MNSENMPFNLDMTWLQQLDRLNYYNPINNQDSKSALGHEPMEK